MITRLRSLFNLLSGIGVIALTLAFFEIGNEFVQMHFNWFLAFLWIGMLGRFSIERLEKVNKKDHGV
ncbi:hypothetical protein [Bacillus pinisoli]|uniref:hypothetical protein n=1 Tax=Bacillus pinisoli TaxID=2901866 RepID=UPI001FF12EDA|nr:hypothetical protein [Bacillus pinisoli]